ncbi:uncharacterized protein LOC128307494 [Anopheles moucheti]|uniref:uncharacterized protein LOC128307494 n=1 Tax=Anopheles moucheti TaxID=186751 RepID=UPI0022EFE5C9|nr:uncharacterized protein LOC128307494 [Anopheles moucheti]
MAEARKIKSLKLQLDAVQQSINAILSFSERAAKSSTEVCARRDNLKKLYERFITIQDELLVLDEGKGKDHFAVRQTVEEAYYQAEGRLLSSIEKDEKNVLTVSKVKLPDMKLPSFDGNPKDWMNFHSIFASMIHGSPHYSGTQKLYYLRTSLSGSALRLIQNIPICEKNYNVAWQLLLKHYNEPKKVKQFLLDALFENAALKKESSSELRKVVENFEANVSALKELGEPTAQWDTLLIHMLSNQLDSTTKRGWKEYAAEKDVETYTDLVAFIYRRISVLEEVSTPTVEKPTKHRALATHTSNNRDCAFCSQHHPLYMCTKFFQLSSQEKEKFVTKHQLCLNCMRPGHRARECKSSSTCKKCRKRHHTQLCPSLLQQHVDSPTLRDPDTPTTSATSSVVESITCTSSGLQKMTLMATATVILVDDDGTEHIARALLDSGSDTCFITENLAQQLKSRKEKTNLKISGISSTTTTTKYRIRATLRSRIGRYFADLQLYVLPKVTENLPFSSIDTSEWNIPSNIFLADPYFHRSDRIDVLIGAEIFYDIMKPSGRIHLGKDRPTLVNSELGWIVAGPVVGTLMSCFNSISVHHASTSVNEVHELMERFWEIEEDSTSHLTSEQSACEEHFRNTVTRTSSGRYVVRLPVKTDILAKLVANRNTAVRRFHLLQTRFQNDELRVGYCSFIDEYSKLGHMKRISEKEYEDKTKQYYYLPHHAVTRVDSATTKLRVVFDVSCKTASGVSLNDALMVGPTIQDDIRTIIMRARTHPIMIIADIKMMYRQILVDDCDTSLQLIVWKSSPSEPLHTYKLCTVTYGTASAPYLATRVLSQLADDEGIEYPKAAQVLKRDFYVDDLVTGSPTVEEATEIIQQLSTLVEKGGFSLRKWATNNEEVRQSISKESSSV